jgi:hypothetical protein
MALTKKDRQILEAINNMLDAEPQLGLSFHKKDEAAQENTFSYLHEHINDSFATKAADLIHADSVTQAFRKLHSIKYIDDTSFAQAFERDMVALGVPRLERDKALTFLEQVIASMKADDKFGAERDAGFNPNLSDIKDLSQPEMDGKFQIHDVPLNKKNVESKSGEASPGHTP